MASGLRPPVVDEVFVAGDASGHCLPLTGEGIRTAVLAGFKCGELLRGILEGRLTPEQAAVEYRLFVDSSRSKFRALLVGNVALLALPLPVIAALAKIFANPKPLQLFMTRYLNLFATRTCELSVPQPALPRM